MGKVISIVNQKGGTSKSALAVNIGVGLVRSGQKVLIVDADPQADASASLGYRDTDDSDETLTELFGMVLNDEGLPEDLYIRHQEEGIDIIVSNIDVAGMEVLLVNAMSREYVLKGIPTAPASEKHISCLFVRFRITFVFTFVRSLGTCTYAITCLLNALRKLTC